jgi:hypothetical protein
MSAFPTNKLLETTKLFWQYPVTTEKSFYDQNKDNENYLGMPWATIIDKRVNLNILYKLLRPHLNPNKQYFTCCQHISFRNLIPLFKMLNIYTLYTSHKILNENKLSDIQLRPCPLYAVNIEDSTRNNTFANTDFISLKRIFLYTFQGAYQPTDYLSDIRDRIFNMEHPKNCFVKNIGDWHFNNVVYNSKQNINNELNETSVDNNRTQAYNKLLLQSRFSLCPSGSGPNSIRFWESLAIGSIPILLSDTLELPYNELWDNAIIRLPENKLKDLPKILKNISEEKEIEMRKNCIALYNYYKNNYINKKTHNMVIFSNCHGEKYINIFKRDTNIHNLFNINYIVSYQQLNNFSNYKNDFMNADVLIINNIKQYNDYTIKNLKTIIKPDCLLIVIPFVRFEGYWLPEQFKHLNYVSSNTVSFFPNVNKNNIDNYLSKNIDRNIVINYFNKCLLKLKQIDNESDIRFYDFFIENHQKYPFFRDNYHPTMNMLEYIAKKIIEKISLKFNINYNTINYKLNNELLEWGHYKPIQDTIKEALNLNYDLDKVFLCSREKYLNVIIENEEKKQKIIDLDDLYNKYFK